MERRGQNQYDLELRFHPKSRSAVRDGQAFLFPTKRSTLRLDPLTPDHVTLSAEDVAAAMVEGSLRVGGSQLRRLRPLRDHRVVQRFLDAVEAGQAEPWHPVVFGLTLAVFSLPVLKGLMVYERQSLAGFLEAASRPLALLEAERRSMIDALPSAVASFAGDLHAANPRPVPVSAR